MGIDRGAVVHDLESLRRRVAWALERFHQSCVVEQFIPFGELTVLVIGNTPPQPLPVIQRPLDPTSRLSCHVDRSGSSTWLSPVELTPTLEAQATTMAITMFHALSCHDMARIDLRVDEQGLLYFLEINPLPSFDPEGSFGLLAEHQGITYAQLIGRILSAALTRLNFSSPTPLTPP